MAKDLDLTDNKDGITRRNKEAVRALTDTLQGNTAKRNNKMLFLMHFAKSGIQGQACSLAGVSRVTVHHWKMEDKIFADLYEEAIVISIEALEIEARRRAMDGLAKPVFYQGMRCGTVQEYSDTLLVLLLKAHKPDKYREKHDPTATPGMAGAPAVVVHLPDNGRSLPAVVAPPLVTKEAESKASMATVHDFEGDLDPVTRDGDEDGDEDGATTDKEDINE